MYKMLVSDFYGTLINSEEAISVSTMVEIDRIRNNGVYFCVTTENGVRIVKDYNKDFPFIDYIIAFNGSYVFDLKKNRALYSKCLGAVAIRKIFNLFKDMELCFYTLDYCYYTGSYCDDDFSLKLYGCVSDFIENNKKNIYKISICMNDMASAKSIIKTIKDNNIKVVSYTVCDKGYFVVSVTNILDNKLSGLNVILNKLNIKLKEVLAVCSSLSSLDLIRKCGYGCVVSNGNEKLKNKACEVTVSNEEKGVEQIIKKYF